MKLSNVRLILVREVCDQLRDRRTLFMIAVLPIVLYPLLGMSMLQVTQFMQERPTRVLVIGAERLPASPVLFQDKQFAHDLFAGGKSELLETYFAPDTGTPSRDNGLALVQAGTFEAALYFPRDFAARLEAFRKAIALKHPSVQPGEEVRLEVPNPEIIYNAADEKSQVTFARLSEVLRRWSDRIGEDNLKATGVSARAMRPFYVGAADVADVQSRSGALWSKILPVLMLLWALTGAFYPAIDLCAGEKERGTLETLLSSPAQRSEIVLGKLLTVMLFSILTAVLNLVSVGITGSMILARMSDMGMPPPVAIVALVIALVPIAALFSALCLALAAFAKSTREGQYYLMPLLLVTMPLVILPMSPGVELNLGNSLIPVTGLVLLLRNVLEGDYWLAVRYLPGVAVATSLACLMAIRWAVNQFNSESVLFRESERLDLGLWLRHLWRERPATPTAAMAVCCGVAILLLNFFASFSLPAPEGFAGFVRMAFVTQVAVIAVPVLLLTMFLTASPRQALSLNWPAWRTLPLAALLAVALHPAATELQSLVRYLYPVGDNVLPALERLQAMFREANVWALVFVIALVPAICEELAFRGFLLSGFRRLGKCRGILYSALFFGLTHGVLQQSLIASLLGVLLGYLAVQGRSILPGVVFHLCHNALLVINTRITSAMLPDWPQLRAWIIALPDGGCLFPLPVVVSGFLLAALVLIRFQKLGDDGQQANRVMESVVPGLPATLSSPCSSPGVGAS